MSSPKVFIADSISPRGSEELTREGGLEAKVQTGLSETQLAEAMPDFAALIIRSQTKATAKILNAAKKLRVVGRAGVGVDNVDVETATRRGVVVLNAPGANTISTAEHAFSLLLSIARNIALDVATFKGGTWDRKSLEGEELYKKTCGIIV